MKTFTHLACLAFCLFFGCTKRIDPSVIELRRLSFEEAKGMSELDITNAVNNAARSKLAIIFVYVRWAPMRPQTDRFAELAIDLESTNSTPFIGLHFIDFSSHDYKSLTTLPGWPTHEGIPEVWRIGGNGELVWIADGRVLHIQTALDFQTSTELVRLTEKLFQLN